jgi:hypothetical protein
MVKFGSLLVIAPDAARLMGPDDEMLMTPQFEEVVPTPVEAHARPAVVPMVMMFETPVPEIVLEPGLPTLGVTDTVSLTAPVDGGSMADTVNRLQVPPDAKFWLAVQAPEDGALVVNAEVVPEVVYGVLPSTTPPPEAVRTTVPEQEEFTPTKLLPQVTADTLAVPVVRPVEKL